MADTAADWTAFDETVVFLKSFQGAEGPPPAGEGGLPAAGDPASLPAAVLAGAETITDIARFGRKKLDLLRRFRPFANGTPAHDHLCDILATLDHEQFHRCFVAWVATLSGIPEGVVSTDGIPVVR
jgi:hypothetical protein